MSFISAGYAGPHEIKYLFIDGGCLRDISNRFFNGNEVQIDYSKLSSGFAKTFYYDAFPAQKGNETDNDYENRTKPVKELFDHLSTLNGFHVYEGITRFRRKQAEQKKVDIMIAVDMLTHSFRRNMHRITFLASDLDFKPLIDAVVQSGMFIILWYKKGSTNAELLAAADARASFDIRTLYSYTTDQFQKQFSIPHAFSSPKDVSGYALYHKWQDINKGEVELYKSDDSFILVFLEGVNPGYYFHIKHDNLEFLTKYVEDMYSVSIPTM
jgi:uncharacterized LabA/DUF88 family protein